MKYRQPKFMLMFALVIISGTFMIYVIGAPNDTSVGSFTINASPTITTNSVQFVDASKVLTSSLTPDDTTVFGLNVTVGMTSGIQNIDNITMWIFDDSVHGADADDGVISASPDGLQLIKITWKESTDTWTISQGSFTQWNMNGDSVDAGTGSTATSYDFMARYQISKASRADVDWNATVIVYDLDGTPETAFEGENGLVTMAEFYELTFSTGTFSWGSAIQPNSQNNTHGALSVSFSANAQWELQLSQTDWSASAETDVDAEANNIAVWDDDGSIGGVSVWVRNTVAIMLGTWDNQAPMPTETLITRNVYIFLNPQTLFVAGKQWSATYTVNLQANT